MNVNCSWKQSYLEPRALRPSHGRDRKPQKQTLNPRIWEAPQESSRWATGLGALRGTGGTDVGMNSTLHFDVRLENLLNSSAWVLYLWLVDTEVLFSLCVQRCGQYLYAHPCINLWLLRSDYWMQHRLVKGMNLTAFLAVSSISYTLTACGRACFPAFFISLPLVRLLL